MLLKQSFLIQKVEEMPYSLQNHYNTVQTEGHVQLQGFLVNYHPVLSSKAASFLLTPT